MAGKFHHSADLRSRLTAGDRCYAAALGALLVFLFAIFWLRTPVTGYQAGATLALRNEQDDGGSSIVDLQPEQQAEIEAWLAQWRVSPRWEGNAAHSRLELTLIAKTEAEAIAAVDTAARKFANEYFQQRRRAIQEKLLTQQRQQLAEARVREEVLEQNVHDALAELQTATREAEASWQQEQQARAEQALAAIAEKRHAPATPTSNPEWEDITARLLRRESEAARLLLKFTRNHPLLAAAELRIAALREELSNTPRYLTNQLRDGATEASALASQADSEASQLTNAPTGDADSVGDAAPRQQPEVQFRLGRLSDRLERLREEFADARAARGEAELALVETLGTERGIGIRVSLERPAHLQQVVGGETNKQGIAAALLAALLAGGGAWGAFRGLSPERLHTCRQLERRLALPLLSSIRAGGPLRVPTSAGERYIWWFLRSCEGALVLLVILTAITLIADSQLSRVLVTDPLRAAGEIVTRWR